MRLYNLTDQPLPKASKSYPQTLKKSGIILEPGGYFDVPDDFDIGAIHGWIARGLVTVGERPEWYVENRRASRDFQLKEKRKSRSLKPKKKVKEEK